MSRCLRIAVATCAIACGMAAPAHAYVYWTTVGAGFSSDGTTLGRADQDGSAANHALINTASGPAGITVDGSHIYWANSQTNSIGRANLDGSSPSPQFIPNATNVNGGLPTNLAIDGAHVYWTDGARYIGRANLDGTSPQPHFIDAGAGSYPYALGAVQGTIYYSEMAAILTVPAGSTTPHVLASLPGSDTPTAMAIAGGYIYYTVLNNASPPPASTIGRVAISGGAPIENFIPGLTFPTGVAVDGQEIYWVDHGGAQNTIGRAQLSGNGVTNAQYNFISEPGGPVGVAVDANVDPTQTSVSCSPASVAPGAATACTARVTDGASSAPPTGTVSFSGDASTFFSGSGSSCTLAKRPDGTFSCTVGVVPLNAGNAPISAAYAGDSLHQPSSGNTTLCAGTGTQCGGGSSGGTGGGGGSGGSGGTGGGGGTGSQKCVVPKLKGKTLTQVRRLLTHAHCKLGKVTRPKPNKRHVTLVVASQAPRPGMTRSAGFRVAMSLKPPPARRHHWAPSPAGDSLG